MISHYLTDNSTIDNLHDELFSLLDSINESSVCADMTRLLERFKEHFAAEVALMQEVKYPYIGYHMDDHNKELQRLQSICSLGYMSKFVIQDFKNQFAHHIEWHDQQFTKWVKENILTSESSSIPAKD